MCVISIVDKKNTGRVKLAYDERTVLNAVGKMMHAVRHTGTFLYICELTFNLLRFILSVVGRILFSICFGLVFWLPAKSLPILAQGSVTRLGEKRPPSAPLPQTRARGCVWLAGKWKMVYAIRSSSDAPFASSWSVIRIPNLPSPASKNVYTSETFYFLLRYPEARVRSTEKHTECPVDGSWIYNKRYRR